MTTSRSGLAYDIYLGVDRLDIETVDTQFGESSTALTSGPGRSAGGVTASTVRQMSASPSIGGSVTVCYTKWDGSRHWTFPATYLGEDEYGPWVGQARGAVVERPGARFESPWHVVVLFPRDGFTAGFYESPKAVGYVGIGDQISVYIDITTTPTWMHIAEGSAVSMADLDLDVVKQLDGTIFVDDRDEFAEHQVAMAYPPDVIEQAEANCARVLGAVQNNDEPYATVGQAWLDGFIATRSRA